MEQPASSLEVGDAPKKPTEVVEASKRSFSLEILRLIRDWQQQHGIRFGDYQRYRGYCTRRLARIRKVLKLPQAEKRHFKKRDVTSAHLSGPKADIRYLHVPLMMAERAWAHAMALRQEANTELRKRFHLVNKLRKACVYALQLQELCGTEVCDARTKLEAEAYSAWLHGTLQFELGLYQKASENLKKAEIIYQNLADALPEEEQALYSTKVAELVPSLRYCAYRISEAKGGGKEAGGDLIELRAQGLDIENLNTLVAQTKTESTDTLQTMDWRGRKVTVRPEKVRLFLLSIQEVDKSVAKAATVQAKIEILETIIMDCRDSIQAVKDEIAQDPKLRATAGNDGGLATVPGILYLLAYLKYIRLIRTIERNLLLVQQTKQSLEGGSASAPAPTGGESTKQQQQQFEMSKKVRPQDLTRLYEIILQNVSELQTIQGMEQDGEYQKEMEGLNLSFKAFRCYYIAVTLVALKRWKEAVALYQRSTNYAEQVAKEKSLKALPFALQDEMKALLEKIAGSVFTAQAYSVLEQDEPAPEEGIFSAKAQKNTKPLFERLSVYKEDPQLNSKNPNVFKLTPDMEPIPCKPLFFDLALNYIEFPSLDHKMDTSASKANRGGEEGKGISGLVKGFLGWGAKK